MKNPIAIHGAAGRMGQRLVALGQADDHISIVATLEDPSHPQFGQDAGTVAGIGPIDLRLTSELPSLEATVIDFSVPQAALRLLGRCLEQKKSLVVATTGFDEAGKSQILAASEQIPIVWAPSMSLAVNVAFKLAATTASALKSQTSGVDVEIIERHHRFKEDAPSGTALKFGETITSLMGQTQMAHGRKGRPGMRPRDEIAYHAVRAGDNPGEHTIVFGMLGETLEITVKASNRDCYALGALTAAKFAAAQPPGLYSMFDVLGLSEVQ